MAADAPLIRACPQCGTRFRVAPHLLEVADGQVRCGACMTVFDGRVEPPDAPVEAATEPAPPQARLEDAPARPAARAAPAGARGRFPHDENWPQTEPAAHAAAEEAPAPSRQQDPKPPPGVRMGARAALATKAAKRPHKAAANVSGAEENARAEAAGTGAASGGRHLRLGGAVAALAVLLIVGVFGLRADAWSQQSPTRGVYEAACAVIGCRVATPKNLTAWEFNTTAVARPGPPEPITLTVELVNNAPYRQRLPTVEVRFPDTEGAEQRLTPRDYQPDRPAQRLAAGERKTVQLRFQDPGAAATRYTISLL